VQPVAAHAASEARAIQALAMVFIVVPFPYVSIMLRMSPQNAKFLRIAGARGAQAPSVVTIALATCRSVGRSDVVPIHHIPLSNLARAQKLR
jgi:hypothetical protein